MAGLLDMYLFTSNKLALHILIGEAEWLYDWANPISEQQWLLILDVEFGAMNEVLFKLYGITGNIKYAR